jgi:hypothetical protein
MLKARVLCIAAALLALTSAPVLRAQAQTQPRPAQHKCDPVDPAADVGWTVTATEETIGESDGTPYQIASSGDWFVDRNITYLPFCNYFNPIGIYSMRSYSLSARERVERVAICKPAAQGASTPVPPYAGACPPK